MTLRAHDFQPQGGLRSQLILSNYLEACKNTIALARGERLPVAREKQLRAAQGLMEQPMFRSLPPDEQNHLRLLYAEVLFPVV